VANGKANRDPSWDNEVDTFSLEALSGEVDASPFGNYRTVLQAREQNKQLQIEVEKGETVRPIYTTKVVD